MYDFLSPPLGRITIWPSPVRARVIQNGTSTPSKKDIELFKRSFSQLADSFQYQESHPRQPEAVMDGHGTLEVHRKEPLRTNNSGGPSILILSAALVDGASDTTSPEFEDAPPAAQGSRIRLVSGKIRQEPPELSIWRTDGVRGISMIYSPPSSFDENQRLLAAPSSTASRAVPSSFLGSLSGYYESRCRR